MLIFAQFSSAANKLNVLTLPLRKNALNFYGKNLFWSTLFFTIMYVCNKFQVGLAVDDIKTVQDNAVLSRLAMQVTLILDVERILPDCIRRRFGIFYELTP